MITDSKYFGKMRGKIILGKMTNPPLHSNDGTVNNAWF